MFRKVTSNFFRTSSKFKNSIRSCSETNEKCRRIILDCDVGTDDAVALFLLLYAEMKKLVKIEMIVCTRGNTTRCNVMRNTIRLLEAANRTDVPVYKGSYETFLPIPFEEAFHGVDGFGDIEHNKEPDISIIRKEPGYAACRQLIIDNPNEITFVGIGPLTNMALLFRLYKDVANNIKDIYIMGGNHLDKDLYDNVLGVGNVTSACEFNFFMDPEAAHVVLKCAKCPVNVLTWETCLKSSISLDWRFGCVGESGGKTWKLITRAEKSVYRNLPSWLPCDAFLVAAMLYPSLIAKQIRRHLNVELAGQLTRGQMTVDHLNKYEPNANLIQVIDKEAFKQLITECHTLF